VLCVEDPLLGAGAAASGYDTASLRKSTRAQLDRLVERRAKAAGLSRGAWRVETLLGMPERTIINFAKKIASDLIVMGTNGRTGPAKLFFGSVVDAVLRRAPAPLLVVARSKPRHVDQSAQARPVIGAIELGEHARHDARRMARATEMMGGQLTLVHVVYRAGDVPTVSYYQPQLAAAQKRLQGIAKSVGAKSRVLLGRPEDEIAAAASEAKAGLIILALRQGRGIFGPRQGATTYRVLCSSTIPVLALPPA
jgi:nucleotide-binding universal stress UspA family protein